MATVVSSAPSPWHYRKSWLERARGPVAILILSPFAALGLLSDPLFAQSFGTRAVFETIGWVIFVAGVGMRFWATLYIGGHKGKSLVTEGPYSLCRNPLYFGNLLLTLSIAFFMGSLIFALGLLIASLVFALATITSEERRLRERMPVEYDHYFKSTPRLFPRWSGFHQSGTIEVDTRCLWIEARRAARYVWIPLACQFLDAARTEAWWPQWFGLLP